MSKLAHLSSWKSLGAASLLLFGAVVALAQQPQAPQQTNPAQRQPQGQPAAQPGQPAASPQQLQQQQQQQQQQLQQNRQQVTANRPVDTMARTPDQEIATCLAIENMEQIALGKLAAQHATNKEVKEFADKLVQDHTQQLNELQKFGVANIRLDANAPAQPQQQPTLREGRTVDAAQGAPINFLEVKKQIAERCIASAQKEYSEKKPSLECDMGFVGSQVVLHKQAIEALKVLRQYASQNFQGQLDQTIKGLEGHLSHAEKLIEKLAKEQQQPSRS